MIHHKNHDSASVVHDISATDPYVVMYHLRTVARYSVGSGGRLGIFYVTKSRQIWITSNCGTDVKGAKVDPKLDSSSLYVSVGLLTYL